MTHVALWQFSVATFLITLILVGLEGLLAWIVGATCAWFVNRKRPLGEKRYALALGLWLFFMLMLFIGRGSLDAGF